MKKALLLIALLLFSILVTLSPYLKELFSPSYLKYTILFFSILLGFISDIIGKEKHKGWWAFFKILTAISFVIGIIFIIEDDKTNTDNFKKLLSESESIFKAQSDSFQENNTRLTGILKNIKDYQERQSNPLPDSCYIMFDLIIDYSNLYVKNQIVNKRFKKVEGNDSIFTFNFSKRNNSVLNYISETNNSLVLTFDNKSSKIKYYTTYQRSNLVVRIYCNQKNEIIYRYNLVPAADFEGSKDYLDFKLIKSSSHKFISALDFQNCDVKMCFGTLYYDKGSGGISNVKARIANARLLLDFNGVDYIEFKKMKQIHGESLNFIGKTDKLTINTLKDDCLSPLHVNIQDSRGRIN